jgi:hypothetical protein
VVTSKSWTIAAFVTAVLVFVLVWLSPLQSQTTVDPTAGTELIVHGVLVDDPLNLRAEPRAGATILATLPLATRIVATGKSFRRGSEGWLEVVHRGQLGWVNARFVRFVQPSDAAPKPVISDTASDKQAHSKRVALVIGNARYVQTPPLKNPQNDARAIAAALKKVGFERVKLHLDLGHKDLSNAIKSFSANATDAGLALVYFAGHGLQVDGSSYLLPVDAKLESAGEVVSQAIELNSLLGRLDSTNGLKLVIVDACRDNPFRARLADVEALKAVRSLGYIAKSIGPGLGRVEGVGQNTLVAYAARDGSMALDGEGQNSPFATAVLKQLEVPGTELGLLFRRVRDDVLVATAKRQEPYTYGSIGGEEVYLWPIEGGLLLRASNFATLKSETDGLVSVLKTADLKALASYVHPISGVNVDGVTLTRPNLLDPDFGEKVFTWRGELIHEGYSEETPSSSVKEYVKKALYSKDYLALGKISFGESFVGPGGSVERGFSQAFNGRPGSLFVDYFVAGEGKENIGWKTLRLIFEKMNDRWFLADVVVMGWVP